MDGSTKSGGSTPETFFHHANPQSHDISTQCFRVSHVNSDPVVDAKVRACARGLENLGAMVETVSIPMHLSAGAIFMPIAAEGATELMMKGGSGPPPTSW